MTFKPGAFKSNLLFLFVLLGALLLCMIAALMLGDYKISIAKILDVLNLKIFDIPAAGIITVICEFESYSVKNTS